MLRLRCEGLESFFNSGKTTEERERCRPLVGLVPPGGARSRPQKAAVIVRFQQPGSCWVVALYRGMFSQVLLQKLVFALRAACGVCVLSSYPLQGTALLSSCCCNAAHQKGRGVLPSSCGTSVCAARVSCSLVACVRCCLKEKDRWESAEEETAASEFCRGC